MIVVVEVRVRVKVGVGWDSPYRFTEEHSLLHHELEDVLPVERMRPIESSPYIEVQESD